ncbi:enoyl-CoA hydratase-related protein [Aminipila luticellarii]|uniref:short-chain-enoyl-CoA hydratase n=1 Tax=Aminipila luticellarii TaxID=2507160 RepID=A0A410PVR2_9FIRM|nr:enoyl-CoA hydratase-related protein [Aminipila luticellarii]QAT43023.1 crotonase [Aminipila luticellarii]
MYENLKFEVKNKIALITISRPQAMNALNMDVLNELYAAFTEVETNEEIRSAILTGEGKAFVAGADIAEMNSFDAIEGRNMMITGHRLMNYMESIEKPIIAAVNGFALGGGCELAMACDIRIASEKAKFGQPEVNLGIIPGFGGTQRLPRLVGKSMGKYLIMTAEMITADEAYRIGLVEKMVPPEELLATAEKIAKTIMSKAPIAVAAAKTVINNGYGLDMKTASVMEIEAFTAPFASQDKTEGMTAFLEKRQTKFQKK